MSLQLPCEFVEHNRVEPAWLDGLHALLRELAQRWQLELEPAFEGIRLNYVAPARRSDGTPCVLKVTRHIDEVSNEIAALRLWDGQGVARLLEADAARGALLVERLEPGTLLVELARKDDDAATLITAQLLRTLWRPASAADGLRSLESWCAAYDRNRAALRSGQGGFPAHVFDRADQLRSELLASTGGAVCLHGDMHHYNVLRADRAEWLAIDPKGLVGDPCFDVCQFLRNPLPRPHPVAVNRRRVDIFSAELALDRQRVKDWCFVHAVLDACWDFEDGNRWHEGVEYAEQTLTF